MLLVSLRPLARVVALSASAWAVSSPLVAQTAPFQALDSYRREVTNFNVETARGAVWSPTREQLFAINTHGSRLVMHADGDGTPEGSWTTIHNPVALAIHERSEVDFDVIVLGGATHAVVAHDSATGAVVNMTTLPSEPGDIVIAPNGHAFVSCMGSNEVVELDLATFATVRTYDIPSQRPRFLFLELNDDVAAGFRVFVAPFLSGNNTAVDGSFDPSIVRTLPVDDPATVPFEGLPDEDLFELVPPASGSGPGAVFPVVKGLGTLILEHVRNPVDGTYCVLSIVSENGDPTRQTEPEIRGDFAENALTVLSLPAQGQPPVVAPLHVDLDDTGSTPQYQPSFSCSFPVAIAVDPVSGFLFVASSTNDRLVLLDRTGNRLWQRDLPQGSIPRDLVLDRPSNTLTIYCWGTNELLVLALFNLTGPWLSLELGNDPTPPSIAAGRRHWYDGENSEAARFTCNTCHPGGGNDNLGWALSGFPIDRKDAMVTQSLLSIEDTFPYHWRGERQLRDFNREAFPGLLGGATLLGDDFEHFKEFVFSLQAPRNPGESLDRVVDDRLTADGVSAVQGQATFFDAITLPPLTCNECHSMPEGTSGRISADTPSHVSSARSLDVAHLRQLFNREVGGVEVTSPSGMVTLPRTGWGLTHEGTAVDVFDFIRGNTMGGGFSINAQQRRNLTALVRQWDQGIAPAAQLGWLLDQAHFAESNAAILQFLIPQAANAWLDVVAFGTIRDATGQTVFARWLYDPASGTFTANDSRVTLTGQPAGTATLASFQAQAQDGIGSNTFLGLPPGNGRRFALDPDNDHMVDGAELTWVPPVDPEDPDSDGDGEADGHEAANGGDPANAAVQANDTTPPAILPGFPAFLGVQASLAEYELRFSEPVTYTITYQRPGDPALTRSRFHPVTEDTIAIQELRPSSMAVAGSLPHTPSTYSLTLDMVDLAGNPTSVAVSHQPTTIDHLELALRAPIPPPGGFSLTMRIDALSLQPMRMGSTLRATVTSTVGALHEGFNPAGIFPEQNRIVVGQFLVDQGSGFQEVPASQISIPAGSAGGAAASFALDEGTPTPVTAPVGDVVFLPPASAAGVASAAFDIPGLSTGDVVRFNVIGVYTASPSFPQTPTPVYETRSTTAWQIANTEDDPGGDPTQSLRGVEVTF